MHRQMDLEDESLSAGILRLRDMDIMDSRHVPALCNEVRRHFGYAGSFAYTAVPTCEFLCVIITFYPLEQSCRRDICPDDD
jgi:hypothetical protein